MKPDLETRIADAFGAKLTSSQLGDLLAEVATADQDAKMASEGANEIALDPATRPDAVAKARKEMEDAKFKRDRMERATIRLQELRSDAVSREKAAVAAEQKRIAVAECEQLVEDLREYDELSRKIAALMARVRESNAKFHGRALAEQRARGFPELWAVTPDFTWPSLVDAVRLPKFRMDGTIEGYLWPKR